MSPTVATFLFEVANFLVLTAALGWFFFRPVQRALAEHREKFEADGIRATQKLAEAEKIEQQVQQSRVNLQAELNELRTRELEAARRQADQILAEARAAAERERQHSHRQVSRMSETRRDALAEVSAAAAADIVRRLLDEIGGPDLQSALIRSVCEKLESFPKETLAPVKIETAQPLTPEQLATLKIALGPAAESADFRTVDGLGAGVRVSTASGLLDASASGLSQFARQSLVKDMHRRANNHNPLQSSNDA